MEIALKIDVDTHQGLGEGVPRLQRLLTELEITATFFIAMGPDNSGRAIMRMFRNPGFLTKMRRTRAISMYGLRTVLSGTLLPARPIALAHPDIIRDLANAGFELGVHGYDHVRWQDHIDDLGDAGICNEIDDAFEVYRAILGDVPRGFAAPGWRTSATALKALDAKGLSYRSDTRGTTPYRCRVDGSTLARPEIPTTLPTLDEVMATPAFDSARSAADFYLGLMRDDALNVHTIHAETEGMSQLGVFASLIQALKERGARFVRLCDFAAGLNASALPIAEVVRTTLSGRAGWISAQGPTLSI
jgi:peptidoglycan/xylan/chitin deacetylase (PgdA/CDA1 family)